MQPQIDGKNGVSAPRTSGRAPSSSSASQHGTRHLHADGAVGARGQAQR